MTVRGGLPEKEESGPLPFPTYIVARGSKTTLDLRLCFLKILRKIFGARRFPTCAGSQKPFPFPVLCFLPAIFLPGLPLKICLNILKHIEN